MARTVFIVEMEELGPPFEGHWLTGRFEGHGDHPWEYNSAGTEHLPDALPWPPDDLRELVRRRPPEERWRDRTAADDPIEWRVDVLLVPPKPHEHTLDELRELRDGWATEAAQVAEAAGAAWDAEPLDTFIADLDAARRRGGGGWFTYGGLNFHLELAVDAATTGQATAEAAKRLTPPPGWRYEARAEPAQ